LRGKRRGEKGQGKRSKGGNGRGEEGNWMGGKRMGGTEGTLDPHNVGNRLMPMLLTVSKSHVEGSNNSEHDTN